MRGWRLWCETNNEATKTDFERVIFFPALSFSLPLTLSYVSVSLSHWHDYTGASSLFTFCHLSWRRNEALTKGMAMVGQGHKGNGGFTVCMDQERWRFGTTKTTQATQRLRSPRLGWPREAQHEGKGPFFFFLFNGSKFPMCVRVWGQMGVGRRP